jgi:hypothetical protein
MVSAPLTGHEIATSRCPPQSRRLEVGIFFPTAFQKLALVGIFH